MKEPTYEEFYKTLNSIKNIKTPELDRMNTELMKVGAETMLRRIYELMMVVWRAEIMPTEWNVARIIPIYKKGVMKECKNYRGISTD